MVIHGVLFDFGYTLFGHASLAQTVQQCALELGVELDADAATDVAAEIDAAAMTPDEIRHPRDLDRDVWAARWNILYAIADDVVAGLGEAINRAMHDPLAWVPFEHTARVLSTLAERGLPVGVISNTGWDVRAVFDAHGLTPFVRAFTLSYEAGAVKPNAQIFVRGCASIGVEPRHALMVGDDPRSDGGAVAVGMRTLLLPLTPLGGDNGIGTVLSLVS
jgi:putative hydrolase of the HAD superfamily